MHKRRREDQTIPVQSPEQALLAQLIEVADNTLPKLEIDVDYLNHLAKQLKREAKTNPGLVQTILDCAVQLPTKLPVYALLIGLLNVEEPEVVQALVERISTDIFGNLQAGGDIRTARLLLRTAAALVVPGVLQGSSVIAAMKSLVEAAIAVADFHPEGSRFWQPYADYLVYMALAALPFGGPELMEAVQDLLPSLWEQVDIYMSKRPYTIQPNLRPFFAPIKDDDLLAESDFGASFLGQVVDAVREFVESKEWQIESIPRVHVAMEAALAAAEQQHELPPFTVSTSVPVETPDGASELLIGALVLKSFPPRGILRILDSQHTVGGRPLIDRLVAEDYILDTVAWWEADRVECAKRLARSLPLPYAYEPLLCEVLFSQMLRVPEPENKPIMYGTLMVDLCKLQKLFPRAMSACVRECFARMEVMDPALRVRLAEWLAYHLSNFEYVWPWTRWEHVLEAPAHDAQRHFCVAVMNRLIRLSYWERVQSVIPEEFRCLLPPKPEAKVLPAANDPAAVDDLQVLWPARALEMVRKKASAEELDAWITENNLESILGSKIAVLEMLARCLIVAGAKSYTHMMTAFDRYYGPLSMLASSCGEEGEACLIRVTTDVWATNPQRASMTIDRLMTLRLVSTTSVAIWAFQSAGLQLLQDESESGMAWEILHRAVEKTIVRVQDAKEDLEAVEAAIQNMTSDDPSLEEAENAKAEKLAYLEETKMQHETTMIKVLRLLCDLSTSAAAVEDEGNQAAVHTVALATLKSFLRRYLVHLAAISDTVQKEVVSKAINSDAKDAFDAYLFGFA